MSHDVFVSYSSKDKIVADALVAALEAQNIRCWYAPRDIGPGMDWGRSITRAIGDCSVMLLIFSNNANQSQRVLDEVYYAISEEKAILPFRIENLEPTDAMRLHLASRHWLDAFQPSWKAHLDSLISSLSAFLAPEDAKMEPGVPLVISPISTVETPDLIKEGKKKRYWFWWGAVVVPLLALLVWGLIPDSLLQRALFNRKLVGTPQSTPTQTKTSRPIIIPSPTPSPTDLPEPDASFEWNQIFGSSITDILANSKPDFFDNFSYSFEEWGQLPEGVTRAAGILAISGKDISLSGNHLTAKDFIIEFDLKRKIQYPEKNNAIFAVDFRMNPENQDKKYRFMISFDENSTENYWAVIKDENTILGNGISQQVEIGEIIGVRIAAIDNRFAVYLNDQPLVYFEDDAYPYGSLAFTFQNPDNNEPVQFTLDNLKFYNIDSPGPEKYHEFALPILAGIMLTEPDFEDDFSKTLKQWGELPEEFEISNGALKPTYGEAELNLSAIWEGEEFPRNYVLRIEFSIDGYVENLPFEIKYRSNEDGYYSISHQHLDIRDYWTARLVTDKQQRLENISIKAAYLPINNYSELVLVVQNHQYIVVLKENSRDNRPPEEAIFYFENDTLGSGGLQLLFNTPDPVSMEIKRLRFWALQSDPLNLSTNPLLQWLDTNPADFEDDFTTPNPSWKMSPGMYIDEGNLVMEIPGDDLYGPMITGSDFALEFTLKIIQETEFAQQINLFQMRGAEIGSGGYYLNIDNIPADSLSWEISVVPPGLLWNGEANAYQHDNYNRFLFFASDDKNAIYLNDELVYYFEENQNGDFASFGSINSLYLGVQREGTRLLLDHLRFWQLK